MHIKGTTSQLMQNNDSNVNQRTIQSKNLEHNVHQR